MGIVTFEKFIECIEISKDLLDVCDLEIENKTEER